MSNWNRVAVVSYQDLSRWDVNYFRAGTWKWPANVVQRLGTVLSLEQIPVETRQSAQESLPIIAKINFGGQLFLRKDSNYERYKGRLFRVQPNRILFSKINARQGCIAWARPDVAAFAVSAEYPVFTIDETKALPRFLDLVLRSRPAKTQLEGSAAGMAKPRTSVNEFLGVQIPLPSLEIQTQIVGDWESAEEKYRAGLAQLATRETENDAQFLAALGLETPKAAPKSRCLAVEWKDMERWGFEATWEKINAPFSLTSCQPIVPLGSVAQVSYGIQKSPQNRPNLHPKPYLRVANVQRGRLDLSEIKYINVPDDYMNTFGLNAGDILFVEGNGSRKELGRVAIWNGEIENCVHQNHLIKVRPNLEQLLPEFAMYWFNSEIGRKHFFRSAKTSSGLGTINSNEVRKAPIPLPPLPIQRELMEQMATFRAQVALERAQLEREFAGAKARLERALLGP